MEYIAYLHTKSNAVKKELDELEELKSTVAELEAEVDKKNNLIESLSFEVSEAESNTRLSRASAALMKESVAYADCYIETAKVLARDISDRTYEHVEDAKGKIDGIMGTLGELSDSILGLYSSMDELKSEYNEFGGVYSETEVTVSAPKLESFMDEPKADKMLELADESQDDSFPSEEDMTDFLRRMETKYKEMLNN